MTAENFQAPQLPPMFSRLKQALAVQKPSLVEFPGFIPAAVVLLLWMQAEQWYLLLIRRSNSLHLHPGEIAFPGGRKDPLDPHLQATALRELQEEVGVSARNIRVLGRLNEDFSFSGFSIAPFVCFLRSHPVFRPNQEIREILPMPLAQFRLKSFAPEERQFMGRVVQSWRLETRHGPIWGATARILRGFLLFLEEHGLLLSRIIHQGPSP